ncbi:MAG: SPOR domain-containing protein [Bacteroidota bacterium]
MIIDGVFEMASRLVRIESPARLHPVVPLLFAKRNLLFGFSFSLFFCLFAPSISSAQQSPQYEEVVFGFSLKDLGSYNISVAVRSDRVYLPVMELFNLFEVYYTVEGHNIIRGTYLSSAFPMIIDPVSRTISVGDKSYQLTQEDMFKGEMDIYLSPEKFDEIFGVTSTININRLQIVAETTKELPALVRRRNELKRSEMGGGTVTRVKFPLRYGRERSLLGGVVLDYDVTTLLNNLSSQGTSYTFTGGGEVAGGDLQGSLVGASGQAALFNDLRWCYVVRENDYFSSFTAGQITTGSDFIPRVTGIALSNEPVEPRVMFDNYVIDGYTDPESDVELYLNDRLIDFQKTDAAGYYRFQFPLTYGTMRIAVKTFSKYGDINVVEKQVQVPFAFVPKGVLSYDLQAGKADRNLTLANDVYSGNANLLYGATNWLTLKGGLERSYNSGLEKPIYDAGFSSRLFSEYIVNVDVAPDAYYRIDANALFASNAGVFAQYAKYVVTDSLLGLSPQQTASLALYLPLTFVSTGTGFRISEDYLDAASGKRLSTRLDLSTRLTGVQLLASYREVMTGTGVRQLGFAGNGLLSATAMYVTPRGSFLPNFLQAFLLRGVATYDLHGKTFQDASFQVSKTFMQIFQFNLGFERIFATKSISLQAGLIMDLNFTRTSSAYNGSNGSNTSRHSLYGSVVLDQNSGTPFLSNREEIGRGGIDVVLFVDNNNNGIYDAGDELIPAKGVKIDGMGKIELGRDSVIRVSQLQGYFRYNLEIDRQQIDPNLVPTTDKFSFVVDPNQFKRIEIPFYRGGTVSGTVYLEKEGMRSPLSGSRIIMRSIDGFSGDTLRTFTDGGFYAMNVAPGIYTLTVDPSQLQFLQAVQKDGPLSVTVHHTPQGDIIENLEIALTKLAAENYVAPPKQVPVEAAPEKKKIIEKAPPPENKKPENKKPEIKKPEIAPQQSAPKPKETVCTVVFVAAKRIFVIEHSRWPTKAAADEVAARLAKWTNLPATVRKGTSETGRASYSVLLGAFQSRRAAEEACAKLNGTK